MKIEDEREKEEQESLIEIKRRILKLDEEPGRDN